MKKKGLLLLFCFMCSLIAFGQESATMQKEYDLFNTAKTLFDEKKYAVSDQYFESFLELCETKQGSD